MNIRKHYAAGITAFVIWGFFAIPLRTLQYYTSGQILYFRILFSSLLLLFIVFGFRRSLLLSQWAAFKQLDPIKKRKTVTLTLLGGALLNVNWLVFIYTVNSINIKTASFSYLICPVITAMLGVFLLKETMTKLQWVAVSLCALSCGLIGVTSFLELGYSFLIALTYAIYMITQRKNQGFDRMILLAIQMCFAFLLLSTGYAYLIPEVPSGSKFYVVITIIAIVFTVLPLFLNLFALNKVNASTIGILMYLNPVFNFTVAFVVYKETISVFQMAGYAIIFVGLILFNYKYFRPLRN